MFFFGLWKVLPMIIVSYVVAYFHFNLLQSPFEFFHCVPFVLLAFFRLNDLELFILVVDRLSLIHI